MGHPESILITIVSYNGAKTLERTIRSAVSEAADTGASVLVLDNASGDGSALLARQCCEGRGEVIRLNDNIGVAAAYNLALDQALERSIDWLFVLDQDTVLEQGCVKRLVNAGRTMISAGCRVGAVCPTVRNAFFPDMIHPPLRWTGHGFEAVSGSSYPADTSALVSVDSTVTSGTLYYVKALRSIGGFFEGYFIDFVDHDCHLRLIRSGWGLWWEPRAGIYHRLGRKQILTQKGLWIEHEPIRYYYMARNMIHGYWRFGGMAGLGGFCSELLCHVRRLWLYGDSPLVCTKFVLKGILHALVGKFGKLDSKG